MLTTLVPDAKCECGQTLSVATSCYGEHVPIPGDLTICAACFRVNRFTDSMGLRPVDAEEFMAISLDIRAELMVAKEVLMKLVSGIN